MGTVVRDTSSRMDSIRFPLLATVRIGIVSRNISAHCERRSTSQGLNSLFNFILRKDPEDVNFRWKFRLDVKLNFKKKTRCSSRNIFSTRQVYHEESFLLLPRNETLVIRVFPWSYDDSSGVFVIMLSCSPISNFNLQTLTDETTPSKPTPCQISASSNRPPHVIPLASTHALQAYCDSHNKQRLTKQRRWKPLSNARTLAGED